MERQNPHYSIALRLEQCLVCQELEKLKPRKPRKIFEDYEDFNDTSEWYENYYIHVKYIGPNSVDKWPNSYVVQFKNGTTTKVTIRDFNGFNMDQFNCYILEWMKCKYYYKVVNGVITLVNRGINDE